MCRCHTDQTPQTTQYSLVQEVLVQEPEQKRLYKNTSLGFYKQYKTNKNNFIQIHPISDEARLTWSWLHVTQGVTTNSQTFYDPVSHTLVTLWAIMLLPYCQKTPQSVYSRWCDNSCNTLWALFVNEKQSYLGHFLPSLRAAFGLFFLRSILSMSWNTPHMKESARRCKILEQKQSALKVTWLGCITNAGLSVCKIRILWKAMWDVSKGIRNLQQILITPLFFVFK